MKIENLTGAVALEGMYRQVQARGMKRGRPQFFEWAQVIVEGMIERGEIGRIPVKRASKLARAMSGSFSGDLVHGFGGK
jgi:hypothetical protein